MAKTAEGLHNDSRGNKLCVFLGKKEKKKSASEIFTNVEDEKLEAIIYKIELYLKLALLKSLFTCPFKTGQQSPSTVQVPRAEWRFSTGGFVPVIESRPRFIPLTHLLHKSKNAIQRFVSRK